MTEDEKKLKIIRIKDHKELIKIKNRTATASAIAFGAMSLLSILSLVRSTLIDTNSTEKIIGLLSSFVQISISSLFLKNLIDTLNAKANLEKSIDEIEDELDIEDYREKRRKNN